MKKAVALMLIVLMSIPPTLRAEDLKEILALNTAEYTGLKEDICALRKSRLMLAEAIARCKESNAEYARICSENKHFLHLLCTASGPLAENIRLCAVEAGYSCEEAEVILAYAQDVNCQAASLAPAIKRLGRAYEIGKLLSFALGVGIGYGIGAAAGGSTSVATSGGSVSPHTGAIVGATTTTTTTAVASSAAAWWLGGGAVGLGLFMGGRERGGSASGCYGPACMPCPPEFNHPDRPQELIFIPELEQEEAPESVEKGVKK